MEDILRQALEQHDRDVQVEVMKRFKNEIESIDKDEYAMFSLGFIKEMIEKVLTEE